MRLRVWFVPVVAASLNCVPDFGISGDAVISCGSAGQCPQGFVCNASSARCVPTDSEDPNAPQLVGPAQVTPPIAKASIVVRVEFSASETLLTPPLVSFVNGGKVRSLALETNTGNDYTYTYSVGGDEDQVASLLQGVMTDRAGNTTSTDLRATITFDFVAPAVVSGSQSLRLTPPVGSVITTVSRIAVGAMASVSFTTSEPLEAPPLLTATGSNASFDLVCSGTGVAFLCEVTLSTPAPPDGSYALTAALVDLAGNPGGGVLAVAPLLVDTTPPANADVDSPGTLVYERRPWGDAATGVAGQPPVSSYRLVGAAGAVAAGATVIVYDGPNRANAGELGRAVADGNGAFGAAPPFELDPVDRDVVYVSVVDLAANESDADALNPGAQAVAVRDVAFTATLIGKVAGSTFVNPHNLAARRRFDLNARDTTVPLSSGADGVDAIDAQSLITRGAASWRRMRWDGSPDGGYVSGAYHPRLGVLVRFGGGSSCSCGGLCGGTWERQFGVWRLPASRDPEGDGDPVLRRRAAMAYDFALDQVLLFGGQPGYGVTPGADDTWSWNGISWARQCTSSACAASKPTGRYGHAMAYDPRRHRVVLFGGSAGSDETWEWDGHRWWPVCTDATCAASRPSGRQGHAMAYDGVQREVVLVGGSSGGDETWAWNGTRWRLLCPSAGCTTRPSARTYHNIAFDAAGGELVLFGGFPNTGNTCPTAAHLADTWRFNGSAWQLATPTDPEGDGNPGKREGHVMAYDARAGRVVLSGGVEPNTTCATICGGGGDGLAALTDTWEWTGASWVRIGEPSAFSSERSPGPRASHAVTYDNARQRLVLYGGSTSGSVLGFCDASTGRVLADTWEWDGRVWARTSVNTPSARCGASQAFDRTDNNTVLFAGETSAGLSNSTFERAGTTWSTPCASCTPAARNGHALAYSSVNGRVILFGGSTGFASDLGDTQRWSGTAWVALAPAASPSPRHLHAMTTVATRVLLVGGLANYFSPVMDVWEWTGATWIQTTPAGGPQPQARSAHAITHDASRNRVLLFGGGVQQPGLPASFSCGAGYPQCEDAWEWDGSAWRAVEVADLEGDGGPQLREAHVMAYLPPTEEVMLHGGYNSRDQTLDDTWVWDGGARSRPAHVLTVPLETAGFVGNEIVTDVAVRWATGGRGFVGTTASDGVTLYLWDGDTWVELAQSAAGVATPTRVEWLAKADPIYGSLSPGDLLRLLVGPLFELSVAVAPAVANGSSYGEIATDYVEVTVHYQRP